MIIKAGKIIVGKELEVKENAAIKIENGKITEIYDKVSEPQVSHAYGTTGSS